ncbi:galactose-3-O-sulfotransferase 2-like [Haliotis cracherodii]|uniref:galactose-3-O-sulfotransferase 2-like n=1 Tax=Haliotis cracherodii TaxID=6455 RepID=UPI0039EB00BF
MQTKTARFKLQDREVNPPSHSMRCSKRKMVVFRMFLRASIVAVIVVVSVTYGNFGEAFKRNINIPTSDTNCYIRNQGTSTITHGAAASEIEAKPKKIAEDAHQDHRRYSSEVRHIAFLKVHKCASSTMLNIFYRFGYKRELNFVLPTKSNYIHMIQRKGVISLVPPPAMSGYDILCNHVRRFNKKQFSRFLPPDTKYIAIVREPFKRMYSAFNFYRNLLHYPILRQVGGLDPFQTYLDDIAAFESKWGHRSFTNNAMARDFGFPTKDYRNISKFETYLEKLDQQFHLVMVSEMFYESLVLLRRLLKWSMEDVIFLTINAHEHKAVAMNASSEDIKPFLALDRILYDHYLTRLEEQIVSEGPDFHNELQYFKGLNSKVTELCNARNTTTKLLSFGANDWHGDFNITLYDCDLLGKQEIMFLNLVRREQIERVNKYGANKSYFQ